MQEQKLPPKKANTLQARAIKLIQNRPHGYSGGATLALILCAPTSVGRRDLPTSLDLNFKWPVRVADAEPPPPVHHPDKVYFYARLLSRAQKGHPPAGSMVYTHKPEIMGSLRNCTRSRDKVRMGAGCDFTAAKDANLRA